MKKKFNKIFIFSLAFLLGIVNVNAALSCGISLKYANGDGIYPKIGDVVEYVCKDYGPEYSYEIEKGCWSSRLGSASRIASCSGSRLKLTGDPRSGSSFHSGESAYKGCLNLPGVESWDRTGWAKMSTTAKTNYSGIGKGQVQMGLFPYKNGETDDGTGCEEEDVYGKGTCSYPAAIPSSTCYRCVSWGVTATGLPVCTSYEPYECCFIGSLCHGKSMCCYTSTWSKNYSKTIDFDTTVARNDCDAASKPNEDGNCFSCSVDAWIFVDSYDKQCKKPVLDVIDANAWHFISEDSHSSAYCVNEGKHFGVPGEDSDNYQWESTYDITKCKDSLSALDSDGNLIDEDELDDGNIHYYADGSSISANQNSRKVCGYGNVLVMGKYLGYSDAVVNAAMRLFAVHIDSRYNYIRSAGFSSGLGLPWYQIITPNDRGAGKWCGRVFDDAHDMHESKVEYNQYLNTYNYLKYGTIKAQNNWDGTWIGEVLGGKDISEIKSPSDLTAIPCRIDKEHIGVWCTAEKNPSNEYLKSIYLFINTIQGNDRLQYYLNELTGNETTQYEPIFVRTSLSKEIVNNYGELTITAEMKDNVEVECDKDDPATKEYCKVERIYVNVNGQSYSYDDKDAYYDYCKKNYCYKVVKYYMNVCTNNVNSTATGDVEVAIITKKTKAQAAVKKLTPCNSVTESQNMYTLDLDSAIKNKRAIKTKEVGRKTYNLDDYTISETTQSIQLCNCPDNTCRTSNKKYLLITTPDGNTYSDINQAKGKNFCAGYNKFDDGNYNSYAYSKVEDPTMNCILNMCYSADKAKYDYSGYYGVNTDVCRVYCRDEVHMFMADKTEAYAGMQFKYDIAGKVFIGRPRSDEVNALTTIVIESRQCVSDIFYDRPNEDGKTWLEMMDEATNKHQNKNTAAQLIIDLENCNLVSNISSNYTTQYNNVHYPIYNKKNLKDSSQNKTTLQLIHELYNANEGGERNNICNGKACASGYVEYENEKVNLDIVDSITISPVSYCNGDSCFSFAKNGDPTKTYISGSYETTSMNTIIGDVTVPVNDFAQIIIKYEADLFNPKKYQVNKYTGVYEESNGDTSKIQLEPYSYPVSLELQTDVYPVKHHYDIKSFYRNTTNQDGFAEVLTGDGALANYTCGYDVYNTTVKYPTKCYYVNNGIPDIFGRSNCPDTTPTDIHYGFVYRNIDLANVFPNVRGYDTNWSTPEGRKAIREIEDSSSDLQVTTKYLQYSYVLNPEAIKSIRADYNSLHKTNLGYINDTLYDCSIVTSESGHNSYRNCKSEFVNELANMTNRYGIVVNKGDGVAAGGED